MHFPVPGASQSMHETASFPASFPATILVPPDTHSRATRWGD
jgi:hypothetical protein